MKSFSKAEIQELLDNNNVDEFKQAILDSKGFILYLADKHGLQISPNLLIDSITPYSIRFITQHMESHPYTKNQKEIVVGYLVDDSEPDLVINKLRFKYI